MQSFRPYRRDHDFGFARAVYGRQPSSKERLEPSIASPYSIDIAFIGHEETWVRGPSGPTYARRIPAGTGGIHGAEHLEFVSVDGSSEFLELQLSLDVREAAAKEFRAPDAAYFDEIQGIDDPVLWAVACRFRAHAIGGWLLDGLEAEELIRTLVGHMVCAHLGGQRSRINDRRLSPVELVKLRDFVEANIKEPIPVKQLADIVDRSLYHFMRTFALTTGMKAHEFVRAIRMERAKEALLLGSQVKDTAMAVGYVPGHSFRKAFYRYFGVRPSAFVKSVL